MSFLFSFSQSFQFVCYMYSLISYLNGSLLFPVKAGCYTIFSIFPSFQRSKVTFSLLCYLFSWLEVDSVDSFCPDLVVFIASVLIKKPPGMCSKTTKWFRAVVGNLLAADWYMSMGQLVPGRRWPTSTIPDYEVYYRWMVYFWIYFICKPHRTMM